MEELVIFSPIFAYILDLCLGEPKPSFHPVCWIGNFAAFLEKKMPARFNSNSLKFMYGLFCSLLLVLFFACIPLLVFLTAKKYLLYFLPSAYPLFAFLFSSFLLYLCIAPKSLTQHIGYIKKELEQNNLPEARTKLSWIVGRNTKKMQEPDIIRAGIESLSENSVDSTISSLCLFTLGYVLFSYEGAIILIALQRIFNTLDAMWGKKNEKYLYFGKFCARTDDVLNYVPARIGFYLIIVSCLFIQGCNYKNALQIGRKYRSTHASPNSAWAEAPYAGALDLKLAGPVWYGDFFCDYPYLGEGSLNADLGHLKKALRLFHASVFCTIVFCTIILALCGI